MSKWNKAWKSTKKAVTKAVVYSAGAAVAGPWGGAAALGYYEHKHPTGDLKKYVYDPATQTYQLYSGHYSRMQSRLAKEEQERQRRIEQQQREYAFNKRKEQMLIIKIIYCVFVSIL